MSDYNLLSADVFSKMESLEWFKGFVVHQYGDSARAARLYPKIQAVRLFDAHHQWQQDVDRVSKYELDSGTPDHYKQCGHLVYWLRRSSPVVEWVDASNNLGDAEGLPDLPEHAQMKELLLKYGNEYLAFDLGYRICRYFEVSREDNPLSEDGRLLTPDYLRTISHFLKTKNVSPHAMYLILKSLFLR
ncbi:MAG: hypothetical protein H7Z12_16620 [Rhodospirillaceae bacterium]|nr:hypothetical protein [Rhodospirillales bacterium]